MEERTVTYGERLVGKKFNPSGNKDVDKVKMLLAEAVDIVRNRTTVHGTVHASLVDAATLSLLEGQMMSVKAITWEE